MSGTATPSFDLSGRIALVTGSSRGIGRSLADGLAAAGAIVVLNGLDKVRLDQARAELAACHGRDRVHAYPFDITDEDQVTTAVAAVEDGVGPIEILVNNAGIQHRVPMLDLELADWRRVVEHNLTSAFIVGRAVARGMVARRHGKIINIGSVQSDLARPTIAPYTAAKGGLRNLTRAMAAEWGGGERPGQLDRPGLHPHRDDPEPRRRPRLQRLGARPHARQVAGASAPTWSGPTVWLASTASSYVNGQTIFVDGGMTAVV